MYSKHFIDLNIFIKEFNLLITNRTNYVFTLLQRYLSMVMIVYFDLINLHFCLHL